MAKQYYVDSTKLESDWFFWLVANATPSLEPYRTNKVLWTKVLGRVMEPDGTIFTKNGCDFVDPSCPLRTHRIYLGENAIEFCSNGANIEPPLIKTKIGKRKCMPLERPFGEQLTLYGIANHPQKLDGFKLERQVDESWREMLDQISKMCRGIAMNFNLRSDEDRHDLAHEALIQVAGKLQRGRLVYIPGKAPVFNLLTTTIHRCMYSILNRSSKQQRNATKLVEDLTNGVVPPLTRSLCMYSDGGNQMTNVIKPR